jgi:SPX domain protein involved in polyphosphate accumulation
LCDFRISPLDDNAVLALRDSGPISSVYFDNETFDCYNDRILRKQSAELFRIRWYGLEWSPKAMQVC